MILVNGIQQDTIQVNDRGLQYGDGLFETLRIRDGKPCLLDQHLQRLALGCSRLAIPMPDIDTLRDEALRLSSDSMQGVLKIIVTRGMGGRGYKSPDQIVATRILSTHPHPNYPVEYSREGVTIRWCETQLAIQPLLAGVKHLNRLEHVLARNEWNGGGIAEGLLCNTRGEVVEGTMSNLFLVRKGVLMTPHITDSGVAGIIRRQVINWAKRHHIACIESVVSREDVMQADELFLTNSIIGIWPVRAIGQSEFTVGPLSQRLLSALDELEEN